MPYGVREGVAGSRAAGSAARRDRWVAAARLSSVRDSVHDSMRDSAHDSVHDPVHGSVHRAMQGSMRDSMDDSMRDSEFSVPLGGQLDRYGV